MNPHFLRLLASGVLFLWAPCAHAEESPLRISIVGNHQATYIPYTGASPAPLTVPIVSLPGTPTVDSPPSAGSAFFVILENLGEKPVRLTLAESDWYDCLEFEITAPSGKTFPIRRILIPWAANGQETWVLGPQDLRVLTVNFRDQTWEGFPPPADLPLRRLFKIKARFKTPDYPQKEPTILESKVTAAFSY